MLEYFLFIAAFINPADFNERTTYPSGLKDIDNVYYQYHPATKNPILKLDMPINTSQDSSIEPGFYQAALSGDKKYILLYQISELKAQFPVSQIISLSQKCFIPTVTAERLNPNQIIIIYRADNTEVRSILPLKTDY